MRYDFSPPGRSPAERGFGADYDPRITMNAGGEMPDSFAKAGDNEEIKSRLRQAQEENLKLQAVISDLTQVNKRWQRYNNDRQLYLQNLLSTIQDQQMQLNNMGEKKAFPGRQGESGEEEKCNRLECKSLRDEVKKLIEKVEVLEYQVKAHKEDWEAEKREKDEAVRERDRIRQKHEDLQREMAIIKGYPYESNTSNDKITNGCRHCHQSSKESSPINRPPYTTVKMASMSGGQCVHHDVISLGGGLVCDGEEEGATAVWDKKEAKREDLEAEEGKESECGLKESYSQSSTVALGGGGSRGESPPARSPTLSLGFNVRLPVVKSSSAPESTSAEPPSSRPPPRPVLSLSAVVPPRQRRSSNRGGSPGVPTQSREDILCPTCSAIFPPDSHLQFLDHFDTCRKV